MLNTKGHDNNDLLIPFLIKHLIICYTLLLIHARWHIIKGRIVSKPTFTLIFNIFMTIDSIITSACSRHNLYYNSQSASNIIICVSSKECNNY